MTRCLSVRVCVCVGVCLLLVCVSSFEQSV